MSGPETTPRSPSSGDERRQREEALRALARDAHPEASPEAPPAAPPAMARRARPRLSQFPRLARAGGRRPLLIAALLVVLLLASGGLYLTHRPSAPARPPIPAVLDLDLTARFSCLSGFSWSPDSRYIAFFAIPDSYAQCSSVTEGFVIAIFDARTGKLYKTLDPAHTGQPFDGGGGYGWNFAWTPDSASIVLRGIVGNGPPPRSQTSFTDALLILPVDGSAPRMLRGLTRQVGAIDLYGYSVWDVKAGTERLVPGAGALPFALTYSWASDGRLVPARPMPTFTSPTTYTGSPSQGKETIWRWQPGTITPQLPFDDFGGQTGHPPYGLTYDSGGSFWSPNGQYYIPYLGFQTLLPTLPGTKRTPIGSACAKREVAMLLCDATAQPAPFADAAFAALDRVAEAGVPQGAAGVMPYPPVQVAWRPDGKLLATMLPDQPDPAKGANASKSTVALYRTDTGALATTLTFTRTGGFAFGSGLRFVFWSPDGKQLAYFDQSTVLHIWGAASLPA